MTPSDIRKLISLAEHGKTRDLAIYAKSCKRLEDLGLQTDAIRANKRQNAVVSGGNFKNAALWQQWADAEIQKLQVKQLAEIVEKEHFRQIAFKSSAKVQALEMLLKTALKELLLTNRRRAEQNGLPPDA